MNPTRFRVSVQPRAERRVLRNALWWAEHRSAEQAERWLTAYEAAVVSLASTADRHAVARESSTLPFEVRQLNLGIGRRPAHRIVYRVIDAEVVVLTVRSLREADITARDVL